MLDALVDWQRSVVGGPGTASALRLIERGALHVTLCFLGMRPAGEVPLIARACDALVGRKVGGLALGTAVWLPRRRPGVLACTIEDDLGELREAQSVLAVGLRGVGALGDEARIFFPHATVARVRSGARARASPLAGPAPVEFAGASLTLWRSVLGVGPARYESLHRVALGRG